MIDKDNAKISIRRQSELLQVNRSSLYAKLQVKDDSFLCNMIADIYANYPIYGYRRITAIMRREGVEVNRKRVQRIMRIMNLRAIFPGPNTSKRNLSEMVYPYMLSGLEITKPHHVWQVDITYLRTNNGLCTL